MRNKKKWAKGEMSRTIVIYCLRINTAMLVWSVLLTTLAAVFDWTIDLTPVLTFSATVFGGELMLLAFKRIFAKKESEE